MEDLYSEPKFPKWYFEKIEIPHAKMRKPKNSLFQEGVYEVGCLSRILMDYLKKYAVYLSFDLKVACED